MSLRIVMTDSGHARSVSIFGWQRLYIGRDYYAALPAYARRALIAHECAHLKGHHTEWRALAMLLALVCPPLWLFVVRRVCHWQEYRADEIASRAGHTHGMLKLLEENSGSSLTHPKNMDRRKKLMHIRAHQSTGDRKSPIARRA